MWKVFLLCLAITTPTLAADDKINASNIGWVKNTPDDVVDMFFDLAISEYQYSNFGFSRDLFVSIVQHTNKKPASYFYLGKIYEEVTQFRSVDLSKQNYAIAATNNTLAAFMRQQSYSALIRLTDDADLAIKYANESVKLGESPESNHALILAYQKKFEKTGDTSLLAKADKVNKKINAKFFDFPENFEAKTQQVNLTK